MRRAMYVQMGGAILALALAAGQASAADPKFLGYFHKSGQIWAYPDATGNWCRADAAVSVLLGAQMSYAHVAAELRGIGQQLSKTCKSAVSAKIAVYRADRSIAGPSLVVRKDNNWQAVADAQSATAPQPQPQQTAAAPAAQPGASPAPAAAPTALTPQPQAPAPTAAPAASPVAQPAAVQAADSPPSGEQAAPAPSPSQPAFVLPHETNYNGALMALVHANPALAQDDGILRYWASYRFPREYQQVAFQEFKLQPLLQQARGDLAAAEAQLDGHHVTAIIQTQFGSYDFAARRFPVSLTAQELSLGRPCCLAFPDLPGGFALKVADLDVISGLPMEADAAQAFVERRTRWGSVNRSIWVAVTVKLDDTGFIKDNWGQFVGLGTLESAAIYGDEHAEQLLMQISGPALDDLRAAKAAEKAQQAKAEAERQAELRRQQLLAQREQSIRSMTGLPASVKLANWISDGQLDYSTRLSNLRTARGAALIDGKPVAVAMLVHMDASGRSKVETKWPGKLLITVADGQPDLKSSDWYLVQGLLTATDGDTVPPAELLARTVYACTQPKCAEAMDATALVDRKLAAFGSIR